jgi:hypothetical protein
VARAEAPLKARIMAAMVVVKCILKLFRGVQISVVLLD